MTATDIALVALLAVVAIALKAGFILFIRKKMREDAARRALPNDEAS